jgi:hypothetical protein
MSNCRRSGSVTGITGTIVTVEKRKLGKPATLMKEARASGPRFMPGLIVPSLLAANLAWAPMLCHRVAKRPGQGAFF